MIHSSVTYKLDAYSIGGVKTWEHSEILFHSLFVLLERNTLCEGHYLEVCLLFPGSAAAWQFSLTEMKVLRDVRYLTCGDLGLERYKAEPYCCPKSWFWISLVRSGESRLVISVWLLQLLPLNFHFPQPAARFLLLMECEHGNNHVAYAKGLQINSATLSMSPKVFRAQTCVYINTRRKTCPYACRLLLLGLLWCSGL